MKKVYGYIKRKTMLYKTGVEYGDYTMNHVQGCSHGCNYPCYAFMIKKRFGQIRTYDEWIQPYLVSNTIELLKKEIPKLKDKINSVQLCFSTDPFMFGYDEVKMMSLDAIRELNDNGIKCIVLTKGVLPKELGVLSKENEYGITLVSLSEDFRNKMEPNSATYEERVAALKYLHDLGYRTWASIEPYPTPNIIDQDLIEILNKLSFVDKIIFGRLNHNKAVSEYRNYKKFYNQVANETIKFCEKNNIQVYIKNGTIK